MYRYEFVIVALVLLFVAALLWAGASLLMDVDYWSPDLPKHIGEDAK
jgi:hypothetical protein